MNCPICKESNHCAMEMGYLIEACWCSKEKFPSGILELIAPDQLNKSCICKVCLEKFKAR